MSTWAPKLREQIDKQKVFPSQGMYLKQTEKAAANGGFVQKCLKMMDRLHPASS